MATPAPVALLPLAAPAPIELPPVPPVPLVPVPPAPALPPAPAVPLQPWEQYAQVLLMSNEFMFVD